jgi:hypothetical protein
MTNEDEQVMQRFAKTLLITLVGFAALFAAAGAVFSMLMH